jgi:hypothetical protein
MSKLVFTISLYAGRMVDTYDHQNKYHYYHDNFRAAYEFLLRCKFLNNEYQVYVDGLNGLDSIQNDADWAIAFLKYSDYGFTNFT